MVSDTLTPSELIFEVLCLPEHSSRALYCYFLLIYHVDTSAPSLYLPWTPTTHWNFWDKGGHKHPSWQLSMSPLLSHTPNPTPKHPSSAPSRYCIATESRCHPYTDIPKEPLLSFRLAKYHLFFLRFQRFFLLELEILSSSPTPIGSIQQNSPCWV